MLDHAQDIKSAGLIVNGSKDDSTEPWQPGDLTRPLNKILLLYDVSACDG